jgi:2',3'-cyclic-nucleotide 2'-phosphodiesterase/3'-nucleotidase
MKWGKQIRNPENLAATAVLAAVSNLGLWDAASSVQAASEPETVELRIIGTTDIHGQLNSKDYEKGVDYNNGGLARLSDLIKKTKSEVPAESVILLDAGDTLFDYTTEYIFSENQQVIQPIYKALATIGYDAITLGNHDFDYGYDYILRQLNGTGLKDITVLSNITDSKTGEHPFLENMMISRILTTSTGRKVEVKIGILGLTIPTLTGKTHSYVGLLKGEDMVTNAKTEAAKLKEMGADVIVALAHTGMGPETPSYFHECCLCTTKISDMCVICGHEHNHFHKGSLHPLQFAQRRKINRSDHC